MKKLILIFITLALIVSTVAALPVNGASSNVGPNNFTVAISGAVGNVWVKYSQYPDTLNFWTTQNASVAGNAAITQTGGPVYPSTTYYWTACDSTGCDATPHSLTTPAFNPIVRPTLGTIVTNMTDSQFNLLYMPGNIIEPYGWLMPDATRTTMISITFGVIMTFIILGFWLRTRSVVVPVILGLLTSGFILFLDSGLKVGIPGEFAAMAQGLLYVSLGGIFLMFLKK